MQNPFENLDPYFYSFNNRPDGWGDVVKTVEGSTLRSRAEFQRYNKPSVDELEYIRENIRRCIAESLVRSPAFRIEEFEEHFSGNFVMEGRIDVNRSGAELKNVRDRVLLVNDQYFNEEEVIQAVKNTFPERFI